MFITRVAKAAQRVLVYPLLQELLRGSRPMMSMSGLVSPHVSLDEMRMVLNLMFRSLQNLRCQGGAVS
jgi:hypothetical protein